MSDRNDTEVLELMEFAESIRGKNSTELQAINVELADEVGTTQEAINDVRGMRFMVSSGTALGITAIAFSIGAASQGDPSFYPVAALDFVVGVISAGFFGKEAVQGIVQESEANEEIDTNNRKRAMVTRSLEGEELDPVYIEELAHTPRKEISFVERLEAQDHDEDHSR